MAATTPAPSFMKQLAANDKSVRDTAVNNLRIYLRSRKQFSDMELMKLWKGLFYCMWMSDKPRNQQQLARDLADLIDVVPKSTIVGFLDAFWKTMAREWNGIGQLRMDKYLYLVRQYLHGSFRFLARASWKDDDMIGEVLDVLKETPLNAREMRIPNGMRYHMIDIYVDEVEKVKNEFEAEMPIERILAPMLTLQKHSPTKTIRERAKETLEDERVQAWLGLEDLQEDALEGDDDDDVAAAAEEDDQDNGDWGGIED